MSLKTIFSLLLLTPASAREQEMPGSAEGQSEAVEGEQQLLGVRDLERVNSEENMKKMKFLGGERRESQRAVDGEVGEASQVTPALQYLQQMAIDHLSGSAQYMTSLASGTQPQNILKCSKWLDQDWYNLQPLQKTDNQFWQVLGFKDGNDQEEILFNFCQAFNPTANQTSWATCQSDRLAYLGQKELTECTSLTSTVDTPSMKKFKDENTNETLGVIVEYTNPDMPCGTDQTQNYGIRLNIICNPDLVKSEVSGLKFVNEENCMSVLTMESQAGCPAFDTNQLFLKLEKYYVLWGLLMMAMGVLCAFFGRKLMKPVIFIVTFFTIGLATLFIFYSLFLYKNETDWVFWVMFFVCAIVGILFGVLSLKYPRVGLAMLCGLAGFFTAALILQTFQLKNTTAFWLITVSAYILSFGFTFIASEWIKIIATSILGGYFIIRGISCFAGGFPNELLIVQELQKGIVTSFPWQFYLYFISMIVVAVGGAYFQVRRYKTEDTHPYHHPNPYKTL